MLTCVKRKNQGASVEQLGLKRTCPLCIMEKRNVIFRLKFSLSNNCVIRCFTVVDEKAVNVLITFFDERYNGNWSHCSWKPITQY